MAQKLDDDDENRGGDEPGEKEEEEKRKSGKSNGVGSDKRAEEKTNGYYKR